ncbi:MAG TPA: hypothetical protein PLD40_10185, partial [Kiritimatiellia bacterium]|nr:hypothetical protein [Kiritimatiellia bacterium]
KNMIDGHPQRSAFLFGFIFAFLRLLHLLRLLRCGFMVFRAPVFLPPSKTCCVPIYTGVYIGA